MPMRSLPRQPGFAFILLALVYFVGARIGIALTVMPEGMAILWIPNSAVLAALLVFRGRHYPQIALIAIAAELAASMPSFHPGESLLFGVTNVSEATLAFLLLRRWGFDSQFRTLADALKFVVAGPILSALVAALGGGAIYSAFHGGETTYLEFVRIWWFGDGLGLLIFTPLLLAFWYGPDRDDAMPARLRPADSVLAVLAAAEFSLLASSGEVGLLGAQAGPIVLVPLVAYVAARFDLRITAATVAVSALLMASLLTGGHQLFGPIPPREAVVHAQEYIFIMSVIALGLFALISQLRGKERELDTANRKLHALNRDLEALVRDRTKALSNLNDQLVHLALTDPLTGLPNRRAFFESARRELGLARRYDRQMALMIVDVDHFKVVNDRFGHHAGDIVLQTTVQVLNRVIRAGDTFARYGGEEFVLLAPETGLGGAVELGNRMLAALRDEKIAIEGGEVRVTASIGITVVGSLEQDLELALKRADSALYAAKSAGRDRAAALAPEQA
jgi:diguanylate cyclase (GGDEF)-like protein